MQDIEEDTAEQIFAEWRAVRVLQGRREEILTAFVNKEAFPTNELLEELAEINIKLGEA